MQRLTVVVIVLFSGLAILSSRQSTCEGCLKATYWPSAQDGQWVFPEAENGHAPPGDDLGVAFSGGGTRSATATLGQLRGLDADGWLNHVRYVSAVSGGAWAAIVYTYSRRSLPELLGGGTSPCSMTLQSVTKEPCGRLAQAIAQSSLAADSMIEAAAIAAQFQSAKPLASYLSPLLNLFRRDSDRLDKTYARLLGKVLLDNVVEDGTGASHEWFTWDGSTLAQIGRDTNGQLGPFLMAADPRPFLILEGSIVSARHDYDFPLLVPVEYTPLYIGSRRAIGEFGGSYVSPWAYDAVATGEVQPPVHGEGTIRVRLRPSDTLTLADIAASTGAAPALATIVGLNTNSPLAQQLVNQLHRGTAFFPTFNHLTVQPLIGASLTASLSHADGGALDNLAIMPLLARHVHNILVFVNTSTQYAEDNTDLRALFLPVGPADGTGDKRYNLVFPPDDYQGIVDTLRTRREQREPEVACKALDVQHNELYGVEPYTANVCFVYNASASRWEQSLPKDVQAILHKKARLTGDLTNFPWFGTFEQNKPHLIQLTVAQVNLLSSLTSWILTDPATLAIMRRAMPSLGSSVAMDSRGDVAGAAWPSVHRDGFRALGSPGRARRALSSTRALAR